MRRKACHPPQWCASPAAQRHPTKKPYRPRTTNKTTNRQNDESHSRESAFPGNPKPETRTRRFKKFPTPRVIPLPATQTRQGGRAMNKARNPVPPAQPILGWTAERPAGNFGFHAAAPSNPNAKPEPIADAGVGHLMTIAPTGAGRGSSVIIPTLLSYPGPVIVIDPKGENYQVTARRRIEMGQQVYKLDPFDVTGGGSHCLNLLDTFDAGDIERVEFVDL